MEYLYRNIHTGAYWTSTRDPKDWNENDWENNDWENPVAQISVFSCQLDKENHIFLSYHELHLQAFSALHRHNIAATGFLMVSETHRDRFRWISSYRRPTFYQPDYSLPALDHCVLQPLDGTRMPDPGEILNIIPEGTNVKSHH